MKTFKHTGSYASTTTTVRFDMETEVELIYDEAFEEAFEYEEVTEVVYVQGKRFVIDDVVYNNDHRYIYATCYTNHHTKKETIMLVGNWENNEAFDYVLKTYELM